MATATKQRSRRLARGSEVSIVEMEASDAERVLDFARSLPEEDVLFLRSDITSPEGVAYWVSNLEQGATFTLLAIVDGAVAGYASVHRNPARWTRRVGEIRVNVGAAHRGSGLGKILINDIFDAARGMGLKKLSAMMTIEQSQAQKVFRRLGFQVEAVLADWVEDRLGQPHDLLIMAYDLSGLTDTIDDPVRV
ncbi:hypothetical protein AYO38_07050 [bacterium SCGC AG-212-C10]|nr:hypothetical protein AYO38_07050 [bacterium SCGC AG-212-C10]